MTIRTAGSAHNRGRDPHIYAHPTHCIPKLRDGRGPCSKCIRSVSRKPCVLRCSKEINKDIDRQVLLGSWVNIAGLGLFLLVVSEQSKTKGGQWL